MALDQILAKPERYAAIRKEIEEAGKSLPDVPYEEIKRTHDARKLKVSLVPGVHVALEFETHDTMLEMLPKRKLVLCTASPGAGTFITSDHPVCLVATKRGLRGEQIASTSSIAGYPECQLLLRPGRIRRRSLRIHSGTPSIGQLRLRLSDSGDLTHVSATHAVLQQLLQE
jgi:hypothetical protein